MQTSLAQPPEITKGKPHYKGLETGFKPVLFTLNQDKKGVNETNLLNLFLKYMFNNWTDIEEKTTELKNLN